MARVQVEIKENQERIKPLPTGVPVFVTGIEYVEGDKISQTKVTIIEQEADENGIRREFAFNLADPYFNEEYTPGNIGKFLMLFQSLSDKVIKDEEEALGGYPDNHKELHDAFLGYATQNFQTIPCNIFLCYPIKKGEVSKYLGIPTVGDYINSPKRKRDLVEFNPSYHSMTPGGGTGDQPEQRGVATPANKPTRNF